MSFKTLKDKLKSSSFGESIQEKISSFIKHDSPEPSLATADEPPAHDWRGLRASLSGSIHDKLSSLVKPSDGAEAAAAAAAGGSVGKDTEMKQIKDDDGGSLTPLDLSALPPRSAAAITSEPLSARPMTLAIGIDAAAAASSVAVSAVSAGGSAVDDVDKEIYEQQLTQLQEQLVSVMIENENLASQLKVKDEGELKRLRKDLECERQRSALLAKRLDGLSGSRSRTPSPSAVGGKSVDAAALSTPDGRSPAVPDSVVGKRSGGSTLGEDSSEAPPPTGMLDRLKLYGRQKFWEFLEDLGDASEPAPPPEAPLAVKRLKMNVVRFSGGVAPIFRGLSGTKMLLSWQYPMLTVVLFLIYMYVVWRGYLLQATLLIIIIRLLLNYAEEKNIVSPISFLPSNEDKEKKAVEKELGVGDKFNIVLHVATKVQNRLGDAADALEKVNNLLMWRQPDLTKQIFFPLCGAFVASLVFSTDTLLFLAGIGLGLKLFVLDNVYSRYPRLRMKYDSSELLWHKLLTHAELEKYKTRKEIEQDCIQPTTASPLRRSSTSAATDDALSTEDTEFCDRFQLPYTEAPLRQSPFKDGKHCLVFEKDSALSISSVLSSHAKLVLTQSFLCYERAGGERKMIALSKITRLEKKKTFSFIPGGGMSLEIAVEGLEKPYIIAGLLNRDECYTSLMDIGDEHGLPYAVAQQWSAMRDIQSGEMRLSALDSLDDGAAIEMSAHYDAFKMA